MKKILLTVAAMASLTFAASAQTRMTIHEEFTGENCGPCAATNPGFWALCDTPGNLSKLIHITYMSPIPSSGWFYMQTQTLSDARISYYSVPFAPYGRYDGHVPDAGTANPGHPGYFHQTEIDSEAALPSPFTLSVTNAWNTTYDSVITTITIHCVTNWTGGTVKLRSALVQTLDFAVSPGSNGETHFENVVRAMYPDVNGTSLSGTWTAGTNQVITLRGAVPSFVQRDKNPYMVVWIQDDASATFAIAQAAKASSPLPPIPNDGAIASVTTPGFICQPNAPYTAAHSVVLKNAGSNTMTSATIYYKADNATTLSSYSWSGSLAAAATTTVVMPVTTVTVTGAFYHSFYDSVDNVNGSVDQDPSNNAMAQSWFIESTAGLAMPYTTSFESADLGEFYATDANNNGETWGAYNASTGSLAHTGSIAYLFDCYGFAAGETEILTLPEVVTSSPSALDFYEAYRQYAGTENDKLEVVYSTNCGASWTSLWSQAGTALSTGAATTSNFVPTAATDYAGRSISISSVPAGSIIGFRGTSDYGNNIWIDDVTMRVGAPATAVENVNNVALEVNIFPNPANAEATIEFSLSQSSDVMITITDELGRVVNTVANGKMDAGNHSNMINTTSMSAGLYNVTVRTESGVYTKHLSIVK